MGASGFAVYCLGRLPLKADEGGMLAIVLIAIVLIAIVLIAID
jgi:hypothetical protein